MPNEHEFLINFPSNCLDLECTYVSALKYQAVKAFKLCKYKSRLKRLFETIVFWIGSQ